MASGVRRPGSADWSLAGSWEGWDMKHLLRSSALARPRVRVAPAVPYANRHRQQHGAPGAGDPERPRIDQLRGGDADQNPDDQVDRHRGGPDSPQDPKRDGQAGEPSTRGDGPRRERRGGRGWV